MNINFGDRTSGRDIETHSFADAWMPAEFEQGVRHETTTGNVPPSSRGQTVDLPLWPPATRPGVPSIRSGQDTGHRPGGLSPASSRQISLHRRGARSRWPGEAVFGSSRRFSLSGFWPSMPNDTDSAPITRRRRPRRWPSASGRQTVWPGRRGHQGRQGDHCRHRPRARRPSRPRPARHSHRLWRHAARPR